jgi:hypothetical protein
MRTGKLSQYCAALQFVASYAVNLTYWSEGCARRPQLKILTKDSLKIDVDFQLLIAFKFN